MSLRVARPSPITGGPVLPRRLRGGRAAVAAVAAVLAVVGSPALASASVAPAAPYLPEPTGPHPVGTTSLHLTDVSRHDPWVPAAKARELMVSVWYPAAARGERQAPYMTPKESELVLRGTGATTAPPDVLSRTRTHAFTDVEPAGGVRSLPLVVLSPGFSWPRTSLTAMAEDLASNGYLVAGIEHTYESFATTFPDGRVTTCAACEIEPDDDSGAEFGAKVVRSRAADVSFVLDELTGPHPSWEGGRLIDPSRIAMAGSSLGGASTVETLLSDSRVLAGANLDGTMFATVPDGGLSRPFLLMGEPRHSPGGQDTTWERDWAHMRGWKRWLVVNGMVHASFTDYDLLAEQIDLDLGSELSGLRTVDITRSYVRAFFDLHLRGLPQPLLDGPSASYPETRFCAPDRPTCE